MIKIENTNVVGFDDAIRGMRNPLNSWAKSDSIPGYAENNNKFEVGPNDHELMMKLAKAGSVHAKFRRMIVVYVDLTAPLYWWKEFDTYKVGTVANSCSTMHKIAEKEFSLEDFSCENLLNEKASLDEDYIEIGNTECTSIEILEFIIKALNRFRERYLYAHGKEYWWQMIQLLPSSYNQKRTVMLNYEVLVGIYHDRKDHKLDEWHDLCDWITTLPYSELITGDEPCK